MKQQFDIHKAPQTPLHAEPRPIPHIGRAQGGAHIRGVEATPAGLIRSTLIAGAAAVAILTVFYLPAEYGVDPTGVGGILGLTEMGQIKQQLYAEAEAETAAAGPTLQAPDPMLLDRLDRMEAQLAAIADVIGADGVVPPAPDVTGSAPESAPEPIPEPAPEPAAEPVPEAAAVEAAIAEAATPSAWRDEVSYTLASGEGIEVKLVMDEGQTARFEWTANGGVVNFDTHGDGGGNSISYEQGRSVPDQTGELTAAFTGNHGWFWRNRTEEPVTITLRTAGDYAQMKTP
mgnify:CR=1 FL=1